MATVAKFVAAAAAGAIGAIAFFAFMKPVPVAPPATDTLVQDVDLRKIASFTHVDGRNFDIVDEAGRHYTMEFTEACPGLAAAKDFSLVTQSYHDLDRFIGVAVNGRVCTFKDFAPRH